MSVANPNSQGLSSTTLVPNAVTPVCAVKKKKMAVKSKKEKEHLNLLLGSHLTTIHETLQVLLLLLFLSLSLSLYYHHHHLNLLLILPVRFWIKHRHLLLPPKSPGTMSLRWLNKSQNKLPRVHLFYFDCPFSIFSSITPKLHSFYLFCVVINSIYS